MKTFVITFSDGDEVNIAVTCPQDNTLFKTFNLKVKFLNWIQEQIEEK